MDTIISVCFPNMPKEIMSRSDLVADVSNHAVVCIIHIYYSDIAKIENAFGYECVPYQTFTNLLWHFVNSCKLL